MQVRWTEQACKALDFIMTCSRDFYSSTMLKKLRSDVARCELLLSQNPQMGAVEEELDSLDVEYRHIVLTKPFKVIYFIYEDNIYIADIWDTRQSTETNKKRIQ